MAETVPLPLSAHNTTVQSTEDQSLRAACKEILEALLEQTPATRFATLATVDGRSYAHAGHGQGQAGQRYAAITSSLMGLIESFSKEALGDGAQYNSIATDKGSIVIVRVPSRAKLHTLCVCADASDNMAMTIRAALDTSHKLAARIDAR